MGVWPNLVNFFFRTSWLPILLNIFKILKFFDLPKGVKKKFFFDFLEIEKIFEYKKGVIFEFMVKSQFSFNSIGYFSTKIAKIREPFFADFLQYLPKYRTEIRENQSGI